MNKIEKQEMLDKFKSYKKTGAVLLGVAAGSFSQGIDLPGDLLKAVIVVGLPLSKPDLETKELIEIMTADGGGYILAASHTIPPETPLENIFALYEAAGITKEQIFDGAAHLVKP